MRAPQMRFEDHLFDAAAASAGGKSVLGGMLTAWVGKIASIDIAAYGGLIVAVIGLFVMMYFKRRYDARDALYKERRDQREEQYYAMVAEHLKQGGMTPLPPAPSPDPGAEG